MAQGQLLPTASNAVEDYAVAQLDLAGGTTVRVACSWHSSTGRDAVIEAHFHGSRGGAAMQNVNGSFFDFTAELRHRASSRTLCSPPDEWGGRALVEWSRRLGRGERYDTSVETIIDVARTLDQVLAR